MPRNRPRNDARSVIALTEAEKNLADPRPLHERSGRPAGLTPAGQATLAVTNPVRKTIKNHHEDQKAFLAWERYANVPSIREGAKMLGIARNTYRTFRNGEKDYSLTIRLAMAALAGNLKPWGR